METVIDKMLDTARRLRGVRASICVTVVVLFGYTLGAAVKADMPVAMTDALLFLGVIAIGAAGFTMKTSEARAARRQQQKLNTLYGRDAD